MDLRSDIRVKVGVMNRLRVVDKVFRDELSC